MMVDLRDWLPIILSTVMMLIGIVTFFRSGRHDTEQAAAKTAEIAANISYIRSSVDEIKVEQRMIRNDVKELETRVSKVEASASSAHKRLDDHIAFQLTD